MLGDSELNELTQEGLFPSPFESEDAYLERVKFYKSQYNEIHSLDKDLMANVEDGFLPQTELEPLLESADHTLGVRPSFLKVWCSNEGLGFFHMGGLMELEFEQGRNLPLIQLRRTYKINKKHLGYSLEEVFLHELLHLIRFEYQSNYEEYLAYYLSKSALRRVLGPIFSSLGVLRLLIIPLIFLLPSFLNLLSSEPLIASIFQYITPIILAGILLKPICIFYKFQQSMKKLTQYFGSSKKALLFANRLCDSDLESLFNLKESEFKAYFKRSSSPYERWIASTFEFYLER